MSKTDLSDHRITDIKYACHTQQVLHVYGPKENRNRVAISAPSPSHHYWTYLTESEFGYKLCLAKFSAYSIMALSTVLSANISIELKYVR